MGFCQGISATKQYYKIIDIFPVLECSGNASWWSLKYLAIYKQ